MNHPTHARPRRFSLSSAFVVRRDEGLPASSWWTDTTREHFTERVKVEAARMQRSWWGHHLSLKVDGSTE